MGNYASPVMENVFDPEMTTETLLAAARDNITSKITTIDAAVELEDRLSEEAVEFNSMIRTISDAMTQCKAGEISREEMLATAAPCVSALKTRCEALALADVNVSDDEITENELAMLREYIVGCKDIVAAHKKNLQDSFMPDSASEGLMSYMYNMDIAQEGIFSPNLTKEIRNSAEARNAVELYKNAKKLYSMGSKDKAIEYMQKAKGLYENCLEDAKKIGGERTITRTSGVGGMSGTLNGRFNNNKGSLKGKGKGSFNTTMDIDNNVKVYKNDNFASVVAYFEDRIDSCEAYIRKWTNKVRSSEIKDIKASLKAERKEIKRNKAAAYENAYYEFLEAEELLNACESYMDELELDLAMEASLEAVNDEYSIATEASGIASSIREFFSKMKKSKSEKEFEDAKQEAASAINELESDIKNEPDPEKRKKLSTAAKVAIAAGAGLLVTAGVVTVGGQLLQQNKNLDVEGSAAAKLLANVSNAIMKVPFKAIAKFNTFKAAHVKGGADLSKQDVADVHSKANTFRYNREHNMNDTSSPVYKKALAKQMATHKQMEYLDKAMGAEAKARSYRHYDVSGQNVKNDIQDAVGAVGRGIGTGAMKVGKGIGAVAGAAGAGIARGAKAAGHGIAEFGRDVADGVKKELRKGKKSTESWDVLDGPSFLASLAMEEANFGDEMSLYDIDNEDGRAFDDELEDDLDDIEESVLESALAVFKLEDGLDPDKD